MNINTAIELLERLRTSHGGDVEVFFDCPNCGKSTAPDVIVPIKHHTTVRLRETGR